MGDEGLSVLEHCIRVGGFRRGGRVATFIAMWAIATRELGGTPTIEEYIAWWKEPPRTAYRYQAEFREVFPGLDTPAALVIPAIKRAEDLSATIALLGTLPARPAGPVIA